MPIKNTTGIASQRNEIYRFAGDFLKGTTPTLLDSSEAIRVRNFIENIVFRSMFNINTGSPAQNNFQIDFTDPSAVNFKLDLQTSLIHDDNPTLSSDLNLAGKDIRFRELSRLRQWRDIGFQFHPQNFVGDTPDDLLVILKLFVWDSDTPYHIGFKTPSASNLSGSSSLDADNGLVWTLPHEDGTDGQVIQTDGNRVLSFVDGGSGQNFGIISVAGQSDVEADQSKDTLTLVAGTGISLTTDAAADSVTITNTDYGGGALTVKEQDGTPTVNNVTTIKFDNGTVTDDGSGVVSVTNSGGGSDFPLTGNQYEIVTIDADGDPIVSTDIKSTGGSGNLADKYLSFVDLKNSVDYFFGRRTDIHAFCEGLGVTTSQSNGPVAEFYESASTLGNYRTLSINHSQHELDGSDQTGYNKSNVLDVHGRITIRPVSCSPQTNSDQYGQIINDNTNNAGKLYMPKNTFSTSGRTQAVVWNVDDDGNNEEVEWAQVIKGGGSISTYSPNFSSGLHFGADSGTQAAFEDGQVLSVAGGVDIATTISSSVDGVNNKRYSITVDYTGGTSDERLKENIEPLKGAAEKVAALRAVEFDWADEKERERTGNVHDFGFVAQEVEKVCPELVREKSDGIKTVEYGHVVPLLLDVIQDLTKRIEVLESKAH